MNKTSVLSGFQAAALAIPVMSLFIGCTAGSSPRSEGVVASANKSRVSIMTYNVENLFDTVHDEGKDDYTYLPLATKRNDPKLAEACARMTTDFFRKECLENDWSETILAEKLKRVVDVIQQVGAGRGPDIQIVTEVENMNALRQLAAKLPNSDYKTLVLLEGRDERGIDPGIMSRLEQWDTPKLHMIPFKAQPQDEKAATSTRGILEARLLLPDGQKISVFAVHLPSQSNPSYLRQQAVQYLNVLKSQLPADVIAVAGGDFNITRKEDEKTRYVAGDLAAEWDVSHLIGCKDCQGSHYFHKERSWSFLDLLIFDTGSSDWKVDTTSIRLANESRYQNNEHGSPEHFDAEKPFGVSDHWPLYAEIYR